MLDFGALNKSCNGHEVRKSTVIACFAHGNIKHNKIVDFESVPHTLDYIKITNMINKKIKKKQYTFI